MKTKKVKVILKFKRKDGTIWKVPATKVVAVKEEAIDKYLKARTYWKKGKKFKNSGRQTELRKLKELAKK